MSLPDYLLLAAILIAVGFAIRSIRKQKGGCNGCCSGCSQNCAGRISPEDKPDSKL